MRAALEVVGGLLAELLTAIKPFLLAAVPILGAAADTVQYASGKNPYDFFRQRNVIPDQEFEAGGWRSHRLFLKHLANSLGAGVVHQFKTNDLQKRKTELEEVLGFPILSNLIGRFIKS